MTFNNLYSAHWNQWLQYSHDAGIQTLIVNPESSLSALPAFQPDDDYNTFKEIILLILKDSANPDAPLQAICNHGIVGLSIPADKHDYNMFKLIVLIGNRVLSDDEWLSILRIIMLLNRLINKLSDMPVMYSGFIPALNEAINNNMPVEREAEHLKMMME